MAEEPRVYTVAPWGYRILLPGILGAFLPPRLIVPGFDWAMRASLVIATGLMFVYLRILGGTLRAAVLAAVAVLLTPSIGIAFTNPFLVEPVALALLLLALIAIEGGAGGWTTALTLVLLSLTKEIWLLLLPLIFIRNLDDGPGQAALKTLRRAAPALWTGLLMRAIWAPQSGGGRAGGDIVSIATSVVSSIGLFLPEYLLGGLSVVALLALSREEARDYARANLLTVLPLLALPLFAAAYTGEGAATSFFTDDVRRLLIYLLPFAAAMAIHLDPAHGSIHTFRPRVLTERGAMVLTIALMCAPLALSRYSRADLSTSRDGPYVLGFTRETLKTARKLDRGESVTFDPAERKFAWGVTPPTELSKLRFFLRAGFGPLAHYGIDDIKMRDSPATLIIPVLHPSTLKLTLTMDARVSAWITVSAGKVPLGEALVGPQAVQVTFQIPADRLFAGDNPIELTCDKSATALPRILRVDISEGSATPR